MAAPILNHAKEGFKAEVRFGMELNDRCKVHNVSSSSTITPYRVGVEPSGEFAQHRVRSLELDQNQLNLFLNSRMDPALASNRAKRLAFESNMWDYMICGARPNGARVIVDSKWTSHTGNPNDEDSCPSFCHPFGESLTAKNLMNGKDEWWVIVSLLGRYSVWMGKMTSEEWPGKDYPKAGGLGHRVVDMGSPALMFNKQSFGWYANMRQAVDRLIKGY